MINVQVHRDSADVVLPSAVGLDWYDALMGIPSDGPFDGSLGSEAAGAVRTKPYYGAISLGSTVETSDATPEQLWPS